MLIFKNKCKKCGEVYFSGKRFSKVCFWCNYQLSPSRLYYYETFNPKSIKNKEMLRKIEDGA